MIMRSEMVGRIPMRTGSIRTYNGKRLALLPPHSLRSLGCSTLGMKVNLWPQPWSHGQNSSLSYAIQYSLSVLDSDDDPRWCHDCAIWAFFPELSKTRIRYPYLLQHHKVYILSYPPFLAPTFHLLSQIFATHVTVCPPGLRPQQWAICLFIRQRPSCASPSQASHRWWLITINGSLLLANSWV